MRGEMLRFTAIWLLAMTGEYEYQERSDERSNLDNPDSIDVKIPFPSERYAEIAYRSLNVDQEPKRGGVKRTLRLSENVLHVHFETCEARKLRVSVNSFMDHIILVTNTMDQFGPPR